MSYAGISSPRMRANVVDYLRTLADHPIPLPSAAPATAPATAGSTSNP
jgi:cytochrome c